MSGFSYYRSITIDHTKVPNTDQTGFQLLFSGTYAWLATVANSGQVQNSNGYDIVFALDTLGQQRLPHQLSLYTAASGLVVMWVRVPTISHTSDTVIYVLYGNSSITTSQELVSSTWSDSSYTAIFHLDGSSANIFQIAGTTDTAITYNTTNGKIYQGAGFNGTTSQIAATPGFSPCLFSPKSTAGTLNCSSASGISVSCWVNPTALSNAYSGIVTDVDTNNGHELFVKSNGKLAVYLSQGTSISYDGTGSHTLSTGTWYHLAWTYDGSTLTGWVNGASDATVSSGAGFKTADRFVIGNDFFASRFFNGAIDEVRVANVARSGDWWTAEYNNQNSPSTFYTVGSETSVPTTTAGASAFVI